VMTDPIRLPKWRAKISLGPPVVSVGPPLEGLIGSLARATLKRLTIRLGIPTEVSVTNTRPLTWLNSSAKGPDVEASIRYPSCCDAWSDITLRVRRDTME
jgi:hypothetical protein